MAHLRDGEAAPFQPRIAAGKVDPRAALTGFFGIMERWDIDNETARILLGAPAERTFFEWKKGKAARVSDDTLRRMGYSRAFQGVQIPYWTRRWRMAG